MNDDWECPNCGASCEFTDDTCPHCGEEKPEDTEPSETTEE